MNAKIHSPDNVSDRLAHSEMLPWLCHVSPEWVLCKDGSLLTGFEYTGVDIDNADDHTTEKALKELQAALTGLDERFYLWWTADKRRVTEYRQSEFQSEAAKKVDDTIGAQFKRGEFFTIVHRMYLIYTGETGMYAFMDNVRRLVNEQNKPLPQAMLMSLNPATFTSAAALADARQLDTNLLAANGGVRQFMSAHDELKFKQLEGWALDNALAQAANPTLPLDTAYRPQVTTLLDGFCALSDIKIGREVVAIAGPNRTVFAANLALANYPGTTNPGIMEALMAMPLEFRLTHVMRCLGQDAAAKTLKEIANYYFMTKSTFLQRAVARFTSKEPEVDPGKQDMYDQAVEAMRRQNFEGLGWLQHAMTVTIIDSNLNALERRVNDLSKTLNTVPFIRERVGLKASFQSMIPGQWSMLKRLMFVNAEKVADCSPIFTLDQGNPKAAYLSEASQQELPSMAVFRSIYGTQYHFNPHVGQVGHALVVMPTGGGKTTFVNFSLTQFTRYPDAQVMIFDRNYSCRILTGHVGGEHIDVKSGSVRLNPMAAIKEGPGGCAWALEFVLHRLSESGTYKATAEDRNTIYEKIIALADSNQTVSLSALAMLLPKHLGVELQEWLKGGPFGMFDNEVDEMSLGSWTCIEMKELMAVERLARAFLDHAFRNIEKRLDGRPTFIYLEEASFLLNNPSFLPTLDDWLKTFRKKNAFVWLTLQSPESISGIEDERVKATLVDNIPNLILGANKKLENHRALYRNMFAMTDTQVDQIGQLRPKKDYLLVSDGFCRVLGTNLSKDALAYLRSEEAFQKLYTEAQESGRADWRDWYIQQALKR